MRDEPLADGFPRQKADVEARRPCRFCGKCTQTKPCRQRLGRRSSDKGSRKQNWVRKWAERLFGVPAAKFSGQTANEENWRFPVRFEVKAGKQVPVSFVNFFLACEAQSASNTPLGDTRPFWTVWMPDDWPEGLVVMRTAELVRTVEDARDGLLWP